MNFQRARSQEQVETRLEEIIQACELLYEKDGYDAVNLKAISEITSFTRPAIYNYFKTKEEIFLEILTREYLSWAEELQSKFDLVSHLSRIEYCELMSSSLSNRKKLLELLSIHLNSIENNTRMERLVNFKKDISSFFITFNYGLEKFFPNTKQIDKDIFTKCFFTYLYGLYPFVEHSPKQVEAMKLAGMNYKQNNFYEVCNNGLLLLTFNLK